MSELPKNPYPASKMFNFNKVAELTGITKDKLYLNVRGKIDTLSDEQKDQVVKILEESLTELKDTLQHERV